MADGEDLIVNGYALTKGQRKPKIVEIGLRQEQLWWTAWQLAELPLRDAPLKVGKAYQEKLRAAGYDVKPIRFDRVIQEGCAA